MIDDIVMAAEHPVRKPIVPHELPYVLDRVQLRALGRKRDQSDVERHDESVKQVPSGRVDERHGVGMRSGGDPDLGQLQAHRLRVAARQNKRRALAVLGTDRTEDVARGGSLVVRRRRAGAAPSPASGDLVLLPDLRLVGEPDLYVGGSDALVARDVVENGGEVLLKSAITPAAWA